MLDGDLRVSGLYRDQVYDRKKRRKLRPDEPFTERHQVYRKGIKLDIALPTGLPSLAINPEESGHPLLTLSIIRNLHHILRY